MIRVADEDLTHSELQALVGKLVKVEYTDSGDVENPYEEDDDYFDGEIYEEVGIVEQVTFDGDYYGNIHLRSSSGWPIRLTMLGEESNRLFFTTDLEA